MFAISLIPLCVALTIVTVTAEDYSQVAVDAHNRYRAIHHVGPLNLSNDLNSRAMQCATHYADKGTIDHSCPHKNGAGENLWAHWPGTSNFTWAAEVSTYAFYSEVSKHDYDLDYQPGTGHFTQVVWKSSSELGVGHGRNGTFFVWVSLYYPHGNVIGMFRDNVLRP